MNKVGPLAEPASLGVFGQLLILICSHFKVHMVLCFDSNPSLLSLLFRHRCRESTLSALTMLPAPLFLPPDGGIWGSGTPESSKNVHFCDACHLNRNFFASFVEKIRGLTAKSCFSAICVYSAYGLRLNHHFDVYRNTDSGKIPLISYLQRYALRGIFSI